MKRRIGTNSTLVLALRTFANLNFSWINFLIPILGGSIIAGLLCCVDVPDSRRLLTAAQGLLATLVQLNGGCLGLILVGFSIYASLPSQDYVIFAISNKPDEGKYSFLKYKLLIFFKSFFWVFFCTCFLISIYAFSILYPEIDPSGIQSPISASSKFKRFAFFFFCAAAEIKILVEVKIFIFTLYSSTLSQARFAAQANNIKPVDEGLD